MTARDVARRVLARVADGAYATLALGGELQRAQLADNDRALCTELVYGVLKNRRRLEFALAAYAPRGLHSLDERTLDTLLLAAHQLLLLRIPAHAAVDDAVEAIKRVRGLKLAGFANALLRKLAQKGEPPAPTERRAQLAVTSSAPDWLVDLALARFSSPAASPAADSQTDEVRAFLDALNRPAPLWLRVARGDRAQLMERLMVERPNVSLAPSTLLPEALRAEGGGDLTRTAPFTDGTFAIQDLAAQVVAHVVAPRPGDAILDACAGVGGKSLHLAQLAPTATVDAADTSERKLELLSDQAHRLGVTNVRTVRGDLRRPVGLRDAYDAVLIDAPCSGLGVLRRHPESKWRVRDVQKEVRALAEVGAAILGALASHVRPGGVLVYSVCTFTDQEGPQQVAEFLRAHPEFAVERVTDPALAALADETGALRTWPHRHDADAFYVVRLRRRG